MNQKPQGGLCNLGNTCYINTTLACLQFCSPFKRFILNNSWKTPEEKLIDYFYELAVESWSNKSDLIPKKFMYFLRHNITQIHINEPNDIHEFVNLLISRLHEDIAQPLSQIQKDKILTADLSGPLMVLAQKMNKSWIDYHKKEWSPLIDIFWGQSISQIMCGHCKKIFHNYEILNNIMLELDNECTTLLECIEHHYRNEILNEWRCDVCHNKSQSVKTTRLWNPPEILIISLKRFNKDLIKNNKKIDIPIEFSINKWCLKKTDSKYKLSSVAYHLGDFSNGHYISVGIHSDKWWKVDDLSCDIVKSPDIFNGYVFFYTKI